MRLNGWPFDIIYLRHHHSHRHVGYIAVRCTDNKQKVRKEICELENGPEQLSCYYCIQRLT